MISTTVLSIALCLVSVVHGGLIKRTPCPDSGRTINDIRCCTFADTTDDLLQLFDNSCGEDAHTAVRMAFHDAAGISISMGPSVGNGADGSIIEFSDIEFLNPDNDGLQEFAEELRTIALNHGISFGDVIQLAGAVGAAQCAGAPRISFMAGRPNATVPAQNGLVPGPNQDLAVIKARMADIGFSPAQTVALLTSHTIAAQDVQDVTVAGSPFDSTPASFDSQFFVDTLIRQPASGPQLGILPSGVFRLQSDASFARDSETACTWQKNVEDTGFMNNNFKAQFERMALLGQPVQRLFECTEVVPNPPPANRVARFPAGVTLQDIEQSCATVPFPNIGTDPGPATSVPPVTA